MKIKDLEKDHNKSKHKCKKCGVCYCTGCVLERAGTGEKFDIIDGIIYCSKHRNDKIDMVYIPQMYKN